MFEISAPSGGNGGGGSRFIKRNDRNNLAFEPGERPHDLEIERALLSGIIYSNDVLDDVQNHVAAADFFLPAHQEIFDSIIKLRFSNTPADLTTIHGYLQSHGKLDIVGGPAYLSQIVATPSSSAHAFQYAKLVSDLSWRRKLLDASERIRSAALEAGDTREIASNIEQQVFSATQPKKTSQVARIGELLHGAMQEFENRANNSGVISGIQTGLRDLDERLSGMRPGQLVVLAARPGMGKTSLAANIMLHSALKQKKNILFFSLEMTQHEVIERVIADLACVDLGKLRSGNLSAKDFNELCVAADKLDSAQFYIDDRSVVTPYDVLATANKLRASLTAANGDAKIDLIVVDYIQIMQSGKNIDNRVNEVGAITGGLKRVAKDLKVPVLALSQLNREGAKRTGTDTKRPQLSDLRDSGSIEQDADVVLFIHREQGPETDSRAPQQAEIIIAKQRSGPTGVVPVVWLGHLTRFSDAIDTGYMPAGIPEVDESVPQYGHHKDPLGAEDI